MMAIDMRNVEYGHNSMIKMSLREGLPNMTQDHLKKVLAIESPKIPQYRWPKSEKGLFTAIAKAVCPDLSKELIEEFWALRGKEDKLQKVIDGGALLTENLEVLGGALDEDDVACVKRVMEESREGLKKYAAERTNRPSMAGVVAPLRATSLDLDYGKQWMPPKGRLGRDSVLHYRWTLAFRKCGNAKDSYSSKTFGGEDGFTDSMALAKVVAVAWDWFQLEVDGFACPYDLVSLARGRLEG